MKSIVNRRIVSALLAAILTTVSLTAIPAKAEEAESKVSIPATTDGIWRSIDQEMTTLGQLIASNKLATVHEHAFAVRDLVAALTTHAEKMSPADQAKLASDSKFVAALASRLDQSGDSGDQAGARSNYDKLKGLIAGIRKLGQGTGK